MSTFDYSKMNLDLSHPINVTRIISDEILSHQQVRMDLINEAREEREKSEEEKRLSLRIIAENSAETVNSLKETNTILKENNQLLREENEALNKKISEISGVISRLAEASKDACDNQEEMMKQALDLAVQLNVTSEENGKLNWKELVANSSFNIVIVALQVLLRQKGLMYEY